MWTRLHNSNSFNNSGYLCPEFCHFYKLLWWWDIEHQFDSLHLFGIFSHNYFAIWWNDVFVTGNTISFHLFESFPIFSILSDQLLCNVMNLRVCDGWHFFRFTDCLPIFDIFSDHYSTLRFCVFVTSDTIPLQRFGSIALTSFDS